MRSHNIVILGGGVAGLLTALRLHELGRDVCLFESAGRLGGRILTLPVGDGAAVDLGSTWFWPHQQRMLTELEISWFEQYTVGDALYQMSSETVQRVNGSPSPAFRVINGMQSIIDGIAVRLPTDSIALNQTASRLTRAGDEWEIEFAESAKLRKVRCKRLVVAIAPRVFVEIDGVDDSFSYTLMTALTGEPTWMAAQAKYVATYDRAFWREQGLSGDVFSRVGPMVEIHDASTASNNPALFGFVGVPARARLSVSVSELEEACKVQLTNIYGEDASNPTGTCLVDWARDSNIATTVDLTDAPRHPELDLSPHFAELMGLSVDFSVSEVSSVEGGYLEGAICASDSLLQRFAHS
ncbi:MAG: NAD(P)-binding protein [Chromatiales bacterium]|jgi:monoamine oxidase|nr:NAD(P)-binding protein [Chromatiales bacterium]